MIKLDMIQTVELYSPGWGISRCLSEISSILCCKWTNTSFDGSGWERRGVCPCGIESWKSIVSIRMLVE